MTADIGKFLQNVFKQSNEKPKAIDLKKLKAETGIEGRSANATSSAILTKLNELDTLDLSTGKEGKDNYLSGTELDAFFTFVNANRTTDGTFLGDILDTDKTQKLTTAINGDFKLDDDEQIKAENYRLINAVLDKVTDNGDPNLNIDDITTASGSDGSLGTDDAGEILTNLKANAEIVVTEEVAKKAVTAQKAEEEQVKNGIVSDDMATAISKGSTTSEDAVLGTWLKDDANATTLKDKLGLTNGLVAEIMTGGTKDAGSNKDNLKSALNNLRLLLEQEIIKKTGTEEADKKPASLEELLNLKTDQFASPFDKIKRDASLIILLALTKKNDYGETGEYQAFTGTEPIKRAESLMKAFEDTTDSLKNYIYGGKGGPGDNWFTNNVSSTVTADQMTNLANINTGDMDARGKAWANFYTSTQGNNIKTFAIQYLLNLDSVKNGDQTVPIDGSEPKDKASKLLTMIGSDTITFDDNAKQMIIQNSEKTTKYTISVKKDGIISWDKDGTGALAALKQIFTPPTTTETTSN